MLKDKKILLGVTGGIAAYKMCTVVRLMKKAGATVRVLMTQSATQFVTPLTFSTLSQEEGTHFAVARERPDVDTRRR